MTDALLQVSGLRIEADQPGLAPLLEGLDFEVAAGERLAIVGESGSGKTMATRAIPGLLAAGVHRAAGSIRFEGEELTALEERDLRAIRGAGIGMVFQEPMTSLNPALTIGKQLAEGLKLHRRLDDAEIRRRCIDMLRRVQIADPERCLAAYPHEFSGGMRQRIMLASVLMLEPRLLIADEPTTALDTLSQREVLELMVALTREMGTALLLITHDLGLVAQYTDRVLVLEKGVLVEAGQTREVLAAPKHPYTAKLVGSLPRPGDGGATGGGGDVLLSIEQAVVEYRGKPGLFGAGAPKRVIDGVDIAVRSGEIVALVGASGSGKTTLGRAALGLKELAGGMVRFDGVDIAAMDRRQERDFRRAAQIVFQDPFSSLAPHLRIGEIVGAALRHVPGLTAAERAERVTRTLEEVGLAGYERRRPHQMSGGQRQRVAIARAIVSRPRLVVADEPVSALDLTIQKQVIELLQALQRERGFACLFVTHDLAVVEQVADRVVVLEKGRIVEEGATAAVFANPRHDYTRRLLAASPALAIAEGSAS
ncbi:dipeptide ABC transporter ATP-binding protein [Sphingopyxis panaciterrulae]|uniref:Peptide/nickel transport system ATP-binding protein n=1 Tax=Sphingopyxis panaciterrulae TaxID=462372 RepID=A0A7W9B462_9SPHN|nr:ABC transporter ATP-binding protein [Sphingopyxis panaciterrulae]MBB5705910.1 peptide/nickel transport system ATP-binding protein [Sphingopyxis panaciterrulae]